MTWRRKLYLTCIYSILYAPILVVVAFSFNNSAHSLLWHGFTWHWYYRLFQDQTIFSTVWHSLTVGISASTIATLFGAVAAITLFRYKFFAKRTIYLLFFLLIIVPDIILAITWLLTFLFFHLTLGFWTLLIAHISFCIPFVFVIINSRMHTLNTAIIESAQDLGATEFTIWRKILLPLMLPALIAGWLLSFTLSIDDTIISYFVTGPEYQTLPLKIYAMVRVGMNPEINALCSLLFLFTIVMVFIVYGIFAKRTKLNLGASYG